MGRDRFEYVPEGCDRRSAVVVRTLTAAYPLPNGWIVVIVRPDRRGDAFATPIDCLTLCPVVEDGEDERWDDQMEGGDKI